MRLARLRRSRAKRTSRDGSEEREGEDGELHAGRRGNEVKTEVGDVMRKDELITGRAADQGMTQRTASKEVRVTVRMNER
jgi:hypothetical protein